MQNIMGNNMLIAAKAKTDYVRAISKIANSALLTKAQYLSTASGRQTKQAANHLSQVAFWQNILVTWKCTDK